jgi:hypothetical protein
LISQLPKQNKIYTGDNEARYRTCLRSLQLVGELMDKEFCRLEAVRVLEEAYIFSTENGQCGPEPTAAMTYMKGTMGSPGNLTTSYPAHLILAAVL